MNRLTTLERAFEIARNGPCVTFNELRDKLKAEGYSDTQAQLAFPALRKQLTKIMQERVAQGLRGAYA